MAKNHKKKRPPTRRGAYKDSSEEEDKYLEFKKYEPIPPKSKEEKKEDPLEVKNHVKPLLSPEVVKSTEWSYNHLTCTKCNGKGHVTERCKVDLSKICTRCNAYGHEERRCEISCGICYKFGHTTNQHGKYCNKCKRKGHIDNECRTK